MRAIFYLLSLSHSLHLTLFPPLSSTPSIFLPCCVYMMNEGEIKDALSTLFWKALSQERCKLNIFLSASVPPPLATALASHFFTLYIFQHLCHYINVESLSVSLSPSANCQAVQAENVTVLEGGTAQISCRLQNYDGSIVVIQNPRRQTLFFNGTRGVCAYTAYCSFLETSPIYMCQWHLKPAF